MKYLLCTLALASWVICVLPASAITVSGILLYSTDDFGDPSGVDNFDDCSKADGQLWRTAIDSRIYYGLGVLPGLPPASLSQPLLNTANFSVEIPLVEGLNGCGTSTTTGGSYECDFTLLGEPGPQTREDAQYVHFAVNLFMDDIFDRPGISVLIPVHAPISGTAPTPNRAQTCRGYSLSLTPVDVQPETLTAYDDGVNHLSISAASFLRPEEANLSTDRVSSHQATPNNEPDYIGVLRLIVETTETPGGQPIRGPVQGLGALPGGNAGSGTIVGPNIPVGGGPRLVDEQGLGDRDATGGATRAGSDTAMVTGEAASARAAEETTTPDGTPTPARTPSPRVSPGTASPTAGTGPTSTPVMTGKVTTPTPRVSTTVAVSTPTPGGDHGSK